MQRLNPKVPGRRGLNNGQKITRSKPVVQFTVELGMRSVIMIGKRRRGLRSPDDVLPLPWRIAFAWRNLSLDSMRFLTAIPTCLALFLAFLLAPFQHVHTGGADHDHAGLIHAHFHTHFDGAPKPRMGRNDWEIDDTDDDHVAVWSLDTFTLILTTGLSPFVLPQGPAHFLVPSETFEPVALVEECGHDPPSFDRSIPRAPPA
jgi:hypothetical protein